MLQFGITSSVERFQMNRCFKAKHTTHCSLESLVTKSIDYLVEMNDQICGKICFSFKHENRNFLLLKVCKKNSQRYHWTQIVDTDQLKIYDCTQIKEKLLFFKIGILEYTSKERLFVQQKLNKVRTVFFNTPHFIFDYTSLICSSYDITLFNKI